MAKSKFETRIRTLFASMVKGNAKAHDLIIEALVHFGQHNSDQSMIEKFSAAAFQHQSHFRYQAYKAWLHAFTPCRIVEPSEKQPYVTVKLDKDAAKFTSEQLAKCKETPFYVYQPADKPLSAPKLPESVLVTLARGLNTGDITEEDIAAFAAGMLEKARKLQSDSKIVDWSVKYLEQKAA